MIEPRPTDQDVNRAIRSWLHEDRHEDASHIAGAVLDRVEATPQRRAMLWPAWRMPNAMNKFVAFGLGAAALVVVLIVGMQFLPSAPGGVGALPSAAPTAIPVGGTVVFQMDGGPATTKVDAVADGASVSGTATTTMVGGTHTVRLECAARDGDTWAMGGTVDQSTIPGESGGDHWSLVGVKDGTPQQIAIWLSADKEGTDCKGWLADLHLADIAAENFVPVESGELVPPPVLVP
jgi:hypothetical protein